MIASRPESRALGLRFIVSLKLLIVPFISALLLLQTVQLLLWINSKTNPLHYRHPENIFGTAPLDRNMNGRNGTTPLINQHHNNIATTTSPNFEVPFDHKTNGPNVATAPEEKKGGPLAIFYNVYFPKDSTDSLKIVQQQLAARKKSSTLSNATLYYTHIGKTDNVTFPPCDPCQRTNMVETGGEVLTLQSLYEHCGKNPSGRVVYIHNKGSLHPTIKNKWLCAILTNAVFSDECVRMPRYNGEEESNEVCDVCATNFIAVPSPEAPGNMFVAECSYVNRLIPPTDYRNATESMMNELWNKTKEELEQMGFATENESHQEQFRRASWVGTDRYAMEQWAFSHPLVRPCDTIIKSFNYNNPRHPLSYGAPKREMAPRQNFTGLHHSVHRVGLGPVHPFFRLEGLLYRYKKLYGAIPPNNSWVYTFFE